MNKFVALTVNGNSVSIATGNDALSAIDTGTTLIAAPTDAVRNLYAQIPNSMNLTSQQLPGFFSFRKYMAAVVSHFMFSPFGIV